MGIATLGSNGGMKFQPAVYDTLVPSGRPTTFKSLATVSTGTARSLSPRPPVPAREIERHERQFVTHQGCQAIRLSTDKGDIEVAAWPESLRKILDVAAGRPDFG